MRKKISGVALVTVIIFIVLISIVAIAMLNLMTNQALLIEHQIKRIKAEYVAEAAIWKNIMLYALGQPPQSSITEIVDNIPYTANVTYDSGSDKLSATVNY